MLLELKLRYYLIRNLSERSEVPEERSITTWLDVFLQTNSQRDINVMLGFGSERLVATELKIHRVSQNNFYAKFYYPYGNDNINHVFCQFFPSLSAIFSFL